MRWKVILDFTKGPSFSYEVRAKDEFTAIKIAKCAAPQYGFCEPVKFEKIVPALQQ